MKHMAVGIGLLWCGYALADVSKAVTAEQTNGKWRIVSILSTVDH